MRDTYYLENVCKSLRARERHRSLSSLSRRPTIVSADFFSRTIARRAVPSPPPPPSSPWFVPDANRRVAARRHGTVYTVRTGVVMFYG